MQIFSFPQVSNDFPHILVGKTSKSFSRPNPENEELKKDC